jgi:hypothetical protein
MASEDDLLKQFVLLSGIASHSILTFYSHRAVDKNGQQWEKVSTIVGRMSSDCRDRYRNHIANRELRVSGQ